MGSEDEEPKRALTSERVEAVFVDCLYKDDEWREGDPQPTDMVRVEGIVGDAGFQPERLEGHRADVAEMLAELPDTFQQAIGGGWSFLNACQNRWDEQWTSLHMRMGQLFQLGMGLGLVKCPMPRAMWDILPGGVPYYIVLTPVEVPT